MTDTPTKPEIAPCPFCGGTAPTTWLYRDSHFPRKWVAHCKTCNITQKGQTYAEAIAAWNHRTPVHDAAHDLLEALVRYLAAVEALGKSPPGRKDNYFEAPLSAEGAIERWQELDAAGKLARAAIARALPTPREGGE